MAAALLALRLVLACVFVIAGMAKLADIRRVRVGRGHVDIVLPAYAVGTGAFTVEADEFLEPR